MQPAIESSERLLRMICRGTGYPNRVERGLLEHFIKRSIELRHAELRPRPLAFGSDRRAGRDELCSWNEIREIVCMALAKPAKADDADFYFIHEFQPVPFSI